MFAKPRKNSTSSTLMMSHSSFINNAQLFQTSTSQLTKESSFKQSLIVPSKNKTHKAKKAKKQRKHRETVIVLTQPDKGFWESTFLLKDPMAEKSSDKSSPYMLTSSDQLEQGEQQYVSTCTASSEEQMSVKQAVKKKYSSRCSRQPSSHSFAMSTCIDNETRASTALNRDQSSPYSSFRQDWHHYCNDFDMTVRSSFQMNNSLSMIRESKTMASLAVKSCEKEKNRLNYKRIKQVKISLEKL